MSPRIFAFALVVASLAFAQPRPEIVGKRHAKLVIRNAMLIDGSGTPMAGPKDILIENDTIRDVVTYSPRRPIEQGTVVIDAKGRYVLPGLINAHGHVQEERGGIPQELQYELNLWLACGITTVRDVSSPTQRTLEIKAKSAKGEIAAPRLFVYPAYNTPNIKTAEDARARVRELKAIGADGMKLFGIQHDLMAAMCAEAKAQGLRIAHHTGVEETNAWDDIKCGTTSIEHWYGIPDAALEAGVQNFPATYNYNNEADRFRYAGRLWREANQEKLMKVFDGMIAAGVAWDPTLSIYEASRDLMRHQNQPWFKDHLHPTLAKFFEPNLDNHGSYFVDWTSTDEVFWKENYRIWMAAVKEFGRRGGLIGVGEDTGFIYSLYGFGLIRELELQQEAGFHPITVLKHATFNNAKILGQENRLGKVRAGYAADLIIVNGNPLEDLKVFYPTHSKGGIEWTIKDGIPYYVPTLMTEVKDIVSKARARGTTRSSGAQ
jgi:imidazolonepropionase-like amidohydrolase